MKKRLIFHGEVCIFEVDSIPHDAKKVENKSNHYVLADSETTGNDHRVAVLEDTEIYERDGVIYVSAPTQTEVFCPNEERHGRKVLEKGFWKVKKAMTVDHITRSREAVRD
jgi:hypothetical protein